MNIIFLLLATSLLLALGFLAAFCWAVKGGQYEDEYTPSVRILFDDATVKLASGNDSIDTSKGVSLVGSSNSTPKTQN